MNKPLILMFLIILSVFPLTYAVPDFAYNRLYSNTQPIDGFNYSINVNTSNFWNTDSLGVLGDASDTQFNSPGGTLMLDTSWLQFIGDGFWCALTGCTMESNINMDGNNLIDVGSIFFDNTNEHEILKNKAGIPFNGIATDSIWFKHDEMHDQGAITYLFTHENSTNLWLQAGKNNSYSAIGNSLGLVPQYMAEENFTENGIINMTKSSDYTFLCDFFDVDCSFNADTRGNALNLISGGPLLFTMGDLEVWQSTKIHEGLAVEGQAVFDLKGNNFNINNGSLHIATPVDFTQGFTQGDSVTKFIETFASTLGIFSNIQSDLGDWVSILSTVFCDEGQCAKADGSGSGLVKIQTNISTSNINETTLSFVYSLVNFIGSADFSIEVNNNVGSGDVEIFSDTTSSVIKSSQSVTLPSSMDDQPKVTITIICDIASATKPNRQCYFDTAKLNGTAISTTLINVSNFDSVISFGDGTLAADGFPNVGLYYNASANTVFTRGNWNITGGGTGVTDHSALTNLEFAISGHTFNSEGQTMDIGSYKFDAGTTAPFTAGDDLNGISGQGSAGDFSFLIGDNDAGRSAFFDDTITTTEIGNKFQGIKTITTDHTIVIGDETNNKGITVAGNSNVLELSTASSLLYATDGTDTVEMLNGNGIDISTDSSGNNIINSNSGSFVVFADGSTDLLSLNVNGNFASIDSSGNIQGTSLDSDTNITAGGKISGGDVGALFTLGLNDRVLDFSTGAFSGFIADDSDGVGLNIENGVSSVNLNTPIATATFVGANVGVGMVDPAYLLEVGDDIIASDQFIAVGSGNNNNKGYLFRRSGNTDNSIIQNSEEDLVINYRQTDLSGTDFKILRGSDGTLTAIFNKDGEFELYGNINATKNITIVDNLFINNIIGNKLGAGNITYEADVHRFDGVLALNQEYDGLGGYIPDLLLNGGISIVRPTDTTYTYLLSAFDVAKNMLGFVRVQPNGQMVIRSENESVLIQGTVAGIDITDPDVKFKIRSNLGGVGDSGLTVYHSAGSLTGMEGSAVRHYGGFWSALVGIQGNNAVASALYTDGNVRMVNGDLFVNDNIMIGSTSSPSFPLEVYGNGSSNVSIWAEGNISAGGFVTRTNVFDNSRGSPFKFIKEPNYYRNNGQVNGEINHSKFYGTVKYNKIDMSRPEIEQYIEESCDKVLINYTEEIKEVCDIVLGKIKCNNISNQIPIYKDINCTKVIMEREIFPYMIEEKGVSLDAEIEVLRQAIYLLKKCSDESISWKNYKECADGI